LRCCKRFASLFPVIRQQCCALIELVRITLLDRSKMNPALPRFDNDSLACASISVAPTTPMSNTRNATSSCSFLRQLLRELA